MRTASVPTTVRSPRPTRTCGATRRLTIATHRRGPAAFRRIRSSCRHPTTTSSPRVSVSTREPRRERPTMTWRERPDPWTATGSMAPSMTWGHTSIVLPPFAATASWIRARPATMVWPTAPTAIAPLIVPDLGHGAVMVTWIWGTRTVTTQTATIRTPVCPHAWRPPAGMVSCGRATRTVTTETATIRTPV